MTPPAAAATAGAVPATHRGRAAAPARPSIAPRKPRRVSGPTRPPARPPARPARPARPPAPSVQAERALVPWLAQSLSGLTRNRSLDRLIRSRTWIALIAFALIGIVTLQLLVLRLNADIGHALVRESALQRENAALSIESSELAAGERVETEAAHLGMELVPEGSLRFLTSNPAGDVARAAAALKTPVHATGTTGGASSSSSTATSASTAASNEAPSSEETATGAVTGTPGEQATPATQEPAPSTNTGTTGTTGSQAAGTEAPAGEVLAPTPSATATATGAAEAAGGTGTSQSTPAG
jgi:cell division protein FtsL